MKLVKNINIPNVGLNLLNYSFIYQTSVNALQIDLTKTVAKVKIINYYSGLNKNFC